MIPLNELRIGNWTLYPHSVKEYYQITEGRKINLADILHPIPITPEILGKCGFEDKYNNKQWDLPKWSFRIRWDNNGFGKTGYWWQTNDGFNGILLTSLHQLQNLYFAVEEKELEVNL